MNLQRITEVPQKNKNVFASICLSKLVKVRYSMVYKVRGTCNILQGQFQHSYACYLGRHSASIVHSIDVSLMNGLGPLM